MRHARLGYICSRTVCVRTVATNVGSRKTETGSAARRQRIAAARQAGITRVRAVTSTAAGTGRYEVQLYMDAAAKPCASRTSTLYLGSYPEWPKKVPSLGFST